MLDSIKEWWHGLWVEHYELTVWFDDQTITNLEDNTQTTTKFHQGKKERGGKKKKEWATQTAPTVKMESSSQMKQSTNSVPI